MDFEQSPIHKFIGHLDRDEIVDCFMRTEAKVCGLTMVSQPERLRRWANWSEEFCEYYEDRFWEDGEESESEGL